MEWEIFSPLSQWTHDLKFIRPSRYYMSFSEKIDLDNLSTTGPTIDGITVKLIERKTELEDLLIKLSTSKNNPH